MKKASLMLVLSLISIGLHSQFVAKVVMDKQIPGICDTAKVYYLMLGFTGQAEAVSPVSEDSIVSLLNSQVKFLKENPKYKDKGMVSVMINCKGKVVECVMDNKTKNPELDKQIVAVFNSLGLWTAGKLNGEAVDTNRLFSFKIKRGKFVFE